MQYFKWLYDNRPKLKQIPGFVFMSIDDAIHFSKQFEEWISGDRTKNLYQFDGVEPTLINQTLNSSFGIRHSEQQLERNKRLRKLSNIELEQTLAYFESVDDDHFHKHDSDVELMLSVALTVGCIAYGGPKNKFVSTHEALYMWPTDMKIISDTELIAGTIE